VLLEAFSFSDPLSLFINCFLNAPADFARPDDARPGGRRRRNRRGPGPALILCILENEDESNRGGRLRPDLGADAQASRSSRALTRRLAFKLGTSLFAPSNAADFQRLTRAA
jgi:hypothetical protein